MATTIRSNISRSRATDISGPPVRPAVQSRLIVHVERLHTDNSRLFSNGPTFHQNDQFDRMNRGTSGAGKTRTRGPESLEQRARRNEEHLMTAPDVACRSNRPPLVAMLSAPHRHADVTRWRFE